MSQGIMERNLPVADSIGEGDKVRIVTSAGNSKNIYASLIGSGILKVNIIEGSDDLSLDKSYNEIISAFDAGIFPVFIYNDGLSAIYTMAAYGTYTCPSDSSITVCQIDIKRVSGQTISMYASNPDANMTNTNPCGGE